MELQHIQQMEHKEIEDEIPVVTVGQETAENRTTKAEMSEKNISRIFLLQRQ